MSTFSELTCPSCKQQLLSGAFEATVSRHALAFSRAGAHVLLPLYWPLVQVAPPVRFAVNQLSRASPSIGSHLRSVIFLFLMFLGWPAPSPLILIAGAYLTGIVWLAFEAWRVPVIENIQLPPAHS